MKKRIILVCCVVLLIFTLSACSKLKSDETNYYTRPHIEPQSMKNTVVSGISTYDKLRETLEDIISTIQTDVSLIVVNYEGDIISDLEKMVNYLTTEYPLGTYAVSSVKFSTSVIASYCEVEVIISYNRSYDEISGVTQVMTIDDIEKLFCSMIKAKDLQRAFVLHEIEVTEQELEDIFYKAWVESSYYAHGIKCVDFTGYPSLGNNGCIVDTVISLTDNILDIEQTIKDSIKAAQTIASDCAFVQTADKLDFVLDWLEHNVYYDEYATKAFNEMFDDIPKTVNYTAAGAFLNGSAAQTGITISSSVLLTALNVKHQVVAGKLNGLPYTWIYLKLGEEYVHFDPCSVYFSPHESCIIKAKSAEKIFDWDEKLYKLDR